MSQEINNSFIINLKNKHQPFISEYLKLISSDKQIDDTSNNELYNSIVVTYKKIYDTFPNNLKKVMESSVFQFVYKKNMLGIIINNDQITDYIIKYRFSVCNFHLSQKIIKMVKRQYPDDKGILLQHFTSFFSFIVFEKSLEDMIKNKRFKLIPAQCKLNIETDIIDLNYFQVMPSQTSKQRRLSMFNNFFKRAKINVSSKDKKELYAQFITIRRHLEILREDDIHPDCLKILNKKYQKIVIKNIFIHIQGEYITTSGILFANGLPQSHIALIRKYNEQKFFIIGLGYKGECEKHVLCLTPKINIQIPLVKLSDNPVLMFNIKYNKGYHDILLSNNVNVISQSQKNKQTYSYKNDHTDNTLFNIKLNKKFINIFSKYVSSYISDINIYHYIYKNIDKEIISLLCATTNSGSIHHYLWLNHPQFRDVRIQAIKSFPFLLNVIRNQNNICIDINVDEITDIIDNRKELVPFLRSKGWSKNTIKVVLSRSWHVFGKDIFNALLSIYPELLNIFVERNQNIRISKKNQLEIDNLLHISQIPSVFIKKYEKDFSIQSNNKISDIQDYLYFLSRFFDNNFYLDNELGHPFELTLKSSFQNIKPCDPNFDLFVYDSFKELEEASIKYHEMLTFHQNNNNLHDFYEVTQDIIQSAICMYKAKNNNIEIEQFDFHNWPKIFNNYTNDLGSLTFITNDSLLKEEGKTMNHCVGGYVSKCLSMKSFIAHIESGEYHSTVEFYYSNINKKLLVAQHRSFQNKEPHPNCIKIVSDFLQQLKITEKKLINIDSQITKYKLNKDIGNKYYAYDALKLALPIIKQLLPKRYRKMSITKLDALLKNHTAVISEHNNTYFYDNFYE